ncbi:MAG: SOS response-associated peptidase [Deltaproteobacteria bacterium]|nr:SOS response-associated peptidase [Deltaproteobacteria bacterium]
MCGRFAFFSLTPELADMFFEADFCADFKPRYNIAPTQPAWVIRNFKQRQFELLRWGLIPAWAKEAKIGNRMINARAETLAEKPSFKNAYKYRRCLVPADGFYEWKQSGKIKTPHFIGMKSKKPLAFAGLWETWQPPGKEQIDSFTIVTTEPNDLLSNIHNRMPVILAPETYAAWLDPDPADPAVLQKLLLPLAGDQLEAYPVSKAINSPSNDNPDMIRPEA